MNLLILVTYTKNVILEIVPSDILVAIYISSKTELLIQGVVPPSDSMW